MDDRNEWDGLLDSNDITIGSARLRFVHEWQKVRSTSGYPVNYTRWLRFINDWERFPPKRMERASTLHLKGMASIDLTTSTIETSLYLS